MSDRCATSAMGGSVTPYAWPRTAAVDADVAALALEAALETAPGEPALRASGASSLLNTKRARRATTATAAPIWNFGGSEKGDVAEPDVGCVTCAAVTSAITDTNRSTS